MKTTIKFIFFCLFFSSCSNNFEKECLICDLQGDWVGEKDEEIIMVFQNRIIENQPWLIKFFEPFRIEDNEIIIDSIRFRKNEEVKKYRFDVRYKINYLENDSLVLNKYWINNKSESEELILKRLNQLNKYKFDKLSISSSPCYGSCPVFQLEINSSGNIKYQGNSFVEKEGNFEGNLGIEDIELIKSQIDKIDWNELKEYYWKEVTDIQYFNVEMVDKEGKKYSLTTNSPMTKAINILIFRSFKIAENTDLEQVDKEFLFSTDLKSDREK